jgi:WD40 repeat protein
VNSICLIAGGDRLITTSSDWRLLLWKLGTRAPLEELPFKGNSVQLSSRDCFIAAVEGPWLTLLNFAERSQINRFKPFPKRTTALAFHPQEKWLAAGGQGNAIRLFDLPSGDPGHAIPQAHEGYVLSLVIFARWAPSGLHRL